MCRLSLIAVFLATAFTAGVDCRRIISSSKHSLESRSGHAAGAGPHTYPHSAGLSGGRPSQHSHPSVYSAPQQINYSPVHGAVPAQPYPVYRGTPPVYVNTIHDSGSKFSTLLAGLALYNLGRSAAGVGGPARGQDKDGPGEACALRIVQDMNVDRVKIPCYIVSTFTDAQSVKSALPNNTESATPPPPPPVHAALNMTTPAPTLLPAPSSNEAADLALRQDNATSMAANNTSSSNSSGEKMSSDNAEVPKMIANSDVRANETRRDMIPMQAKSSNATATNATVGAANNASGSTPEPQEALKVKGDPIELKKDARCFVERTTKSSSSSKEIECGLLQQYALQSLTRSHKPQPSAAPAAPAALAALAPLCALSALLLLQ